MVTRIAPAGNVQGAGLPAAPAGPKFNIIISSFRDGAELLRLTEDDRGRLVIEGPEDRWDEGAKAFLYQMMQWSGQVGIRWKDEVKASAE